MVLPEPGLETRFSANSAGAAKARRLSRGEGVVLRQDVALDPDHPLLADARRVGGAAVVMRMSRLPPLRVARMRVVLAVVVMRMRVDMGARPVAVIVQVAMLVARSLGAAALRPSDNDLGLAASANDAHQPNSLPRPAGSSRLPTVTGLVETRQSYRGGAAGFHRPAKGAITGRRTRPAPTPCGRSRRRRVSGAPGPSLEAGRKELSSRAAGPRDDRHPEASGDWSRPR